MGYVYNYWELIFGVHRAPRAGALGPPGDVAVGGQLL